MCLQEVNGEVPEYYMLSAMLWTVVTDDGNDSTEGWGPGGGGWV